MQVDLWDTGSRDLAEQDDHKITIDTLTKRHITLERFNKDCSRRVAAAQSLPADAEAYLAENLGVIPAGTRVRVVPSVYAVVDRDKEFGWLSHLLNEFWDMHRKGLQPVWVTLEGRDKGAIRTVALSKLRGPIEAGSAPEPEDLDWVCLQDIEEGLFQGVRE